MMQLINDPWFWVMALTVNLIFTYIGKPIAKEIIHLLNIILPKKLEINEEKEKRGIYHLFIIGISIGVFYFMNKVDTVKLISDSLIVSSLWLSIMSIVIYDIGIGLIFTLLKKLLQKQIN